tara:strand:- start:2296 stop:2694 length:399 start_codon:yes stop_codon:yes gene_type:complete
MDGRFTEMLRFGINLKLSGPIEDKYYTQRLSHYIASIPDFDTDTENDESLNIYFKNELVLIVTIVDSTLAFAPQTESSYDGIMVVLDFIANLHQMVQDDFHREGYIEGEFSEEIMSEEEPDVDSDDDDYEWI